MELVFALADEDLVPKDSDKCHPYDEVLNEIAIYYDSMVDESLSIEQKLQSMSNAFSCATKYCASRGYLFVKVIDQGKVITSPHLDSAKTINKDLKTKLKKIIFSASGNVFSIAAESVMSECFEGNIEKVDLEIDQCLSNDSILRLRDEILGKPKDDSDGENSLSEIANAAILEIVTERIGRNPLILRLFFTFVLKSMLPISKALTLFELSFPHSHDKSKIMAEHRAIMREKEAMALVLLMIADCAPPLTPNGLSILHTSHNPQIQKSLDFKRRKIHYFTRQEERELAAGNVTLREVTLNCCAQELYSFVWDDNNTDLQHVSIKQINPRSPFFILSDPGMARKYINRKYMFIDQEGYVRCTSPILLHVLKDAVVANLILEKLQTIKQVCLNYDSVIYGKAMEAEFRAQLAVYGYKAVISLTTPSVKFYVKNGISISKYTAFQACFHDEIDLNYAKIFIPLEPTFPLVDFAILNSGEISQMKDLVPEIISCFTGLKSSYASLATGCAETSLTLLKMCINYGTHIKNDWKIINLAKRGLDSPSANPRSEDVPGTVFYFQIVH